MAKKKYELTPEEIAEVKRVEEDRKIYMTEKRIKDKFMKEHIPLFAELINADPERLRLYAFEFPVKTKKDGTKKADVVLEVDEDSPMDNKMFVLEFKSKKVDYQSAVAQVLRYSDIIQKQLYRKLRVTPFVIAKEYSEAEIKLAKQNKVIPVLYDHKSSHLQIVK